MAETNSGDIMLSIHYPTGWGYDPYPRNTIKLFSYTGMLIDSGVIAPHPQYSCGVLSSNIFEDHLISLCYTGWGQSYLVHHEPNGSIIRQKEIIIAGHGLYPYKYVINSNNDIVVIGNGIGASYSESIIYGMNMEGDSLWTRIRNYTEGNTPFSIALCNDGGYIISGGQQVNGFNQPFLLKTDPWGGNSGVGISENDTQYILKVYPNSAKDYITFETQHIPNEIISVSDIYGREIAKVPVTGEKTLWDTREVKPGLYVYSIELNKTTNSGKIVIMR